MTKQSYEQKLNHLKWYYVEIILLLSSKDLFKLKFCKKDQSLTVLNIVVNTLMIFNCVFISGVNLLHWRIWAVELNLDVQNIHLGLVVSVPSVNPMLSHSIDKLVLYMFSSQLSTIVFFLQFFFLQMYFILVFLFFICFNITLIYSTNLILHRWHNG